MLTYLILMLAVLPEGINDYSTNIFNVNVTVQPLRPHGMKGNITGKG